MHLIYHLLSSKSSLSGIIAFLSILKSIIFSDSEVARIFMTQSHARDSHLDVSLWGYADHR